eukprot:TRINITY_DN5937_c0_g1_i1.p1 TRINITY_DN5937_c0_g1~~TRINITY_DN5937_c0_g1_i1.p1  ORF type:complete len:194 (-),score=50.59 TRINITY_DN5937_c0_g1_i1:215-796(-)
MELSPENIDGLQLISDSASVTDIALKEIVPFAISSLLRTNGGESQKDASSISSIELVVCKKVFASLSALFVEAARLGFDSQQLSQSLEEYRIPAARIQFIAQKYEQNRVAIKKNLITSAFSFGHIVGVDWRLDYHVKSSYIEKIDVPVYMVSLQVEKQPKVVEKVTFYCSVEEMTDLVNKLRDATRQIERLSA